MTGSARIRIRRLARPGEVAQAIEPAMRNMTHNLAVRMRRLVPKRSYRLHDSIEDRGVVVVGGRVKGTVSAGGKVVRGKLVDYHLHVERGTSRMAAQPYMRPALLQTTSDDFKTRMVG